MWDETVDFVIAGSGGGGLCAGMAVRERGHTVVVLEKTDKLGGSTAMSGGVLWVPNSPLQKRAGVEDSEAAARTYLDAAVGSDGGPGSTSARRAAFLDVGPRIIRFLESKGVKFIRAEGWSDYYDNLPGGSQRGRSLGTPLLDSGDLGQWWPQLRPGPFPVPLTVAETRSIGEGTRTLRGRVMLLRLAWRMLWMKTTKRRLLGLGASLQGHMLLAAERLGVRLETGAAVASLIRDGERIVGVEVLQNGRKRRIRAMAGVLLASGGFARNEDLRLQYGPQPSSTKWTNANPGETGELILAARDVGADLAMMDEAWWIPSSLPPSGAVSMHSSDLAKPHCILVDIHGERFTNEAGSYVENGHRMYERAVPAWAILDSRHRSRYNWGFQPPMMTPDAWLASGYFKKADTLHELAMLCGVDPEGLMRTVERFNGFVDAGIDADFGRGGRSYDRSAGDPTVRPNPNLGTISQGPFYACALYPGDVGTQGGIVTDEHARALTADGDVIGGLYATGNCTASVMGRVYPGAGASIAASFVFGFIAANHALDAMAEAGHHAGPQSAASDPVSLTKST